MKKSSMMPYLMLVSFVLAIMIFASLNISQEVIAQELDKTNSSNRVANNTFSAIGTISSLLVTLPQFRFNITMHSKSYRTMEFKCQKWH